MKKRYLTDKKMSIFLFMFMFLMYAFVYMTKNCYSAAMASIVNEGTLTKSQTGLISGVFYAIYAPLQILGGKFADKYRPEKILITGLIGSAIANFVIFLNQNYIVMLITWAINAVVQFGVWPAVFKIISSNLVKEHRSKALFYIPFSTHLGLFLAYLVAMFMSHWRYNFLFSSIILCAFGVITAVIFTKVNEMMEIEEDEISTLDTTNKEIKKREKDNKMFKISGFYYVFPVLIFYAVIGLGATNLAPTILMESYEYVSPALGNFLSLFIIASSFIGIISAKIIYDRFIKDEIKGLVISLIITMPFLVALTFIGKISSVFAVISLAVVATSIAMGDLFIFYINASFAKYGKNAEAAGISNSATAIGIVAQTYGLATVSDCFGWVFVSWLWLFLAVISTFILIWIYPKWKKFPILSHLLI